MMNRLLKAIGVTIIIAMLSSGCSMLARAGPFSDLLQEREPVKQEQQSELGPSTPIEPSDPPASPALPVDPALVRSISVDSSTSIKIPMKPIRIKWADDSVQNNAVGDASVDHQIEIHSTYNCPYCDNLEASIQSAGVPYKLIKHTTETTIPMGVPTRAFPFVMFTDSAGGRRYDLNSRTSEQVLNSISVTETATVSSRRGQPVAVGLGGTIQCRKQIESALDFFRKRIGEGVKVTAEWDRTGAQTFPLLHGEAWTPEAIYGRVGEFWFSASNAINLPITDVSLGYRIKNGRLKISGEVETSADVLNWSNAGRDSSDVATSHGGVVGVDPMTVLTVISVLNGIWQALHPTADLTLGGNVTCEATLNGDVLTIKFSQGPMIKVTAWWQFNLGVEQVEINPRNVRIGFFGSKWVKERTFTVE